LIGQDYNSHVRAELKNYESFLIKQSVTLAGQGDCECAANASLALHFYRAAMNLRDFAGYRQTKPCAA
jgi:hypothetical protein